MRRLTTCGGGYVLCPEAERLWRSVADAYRSSVSNRFSVTTWAEYEQRLSSYHAHGQHPIEEGA